MTRKHVPGNLKKLPYLYRDLMVVLLGFFTAIPVPSHLWPDEPIPMSRALPLSPLIGVLLGGLTGLGLWILRLFLPPLPSAWLALGLYVILGWSLHLDGLADLADGWGSHQRGEAMRRIMKDSRIGCHGTLALLCSLGIWSSLAASLPIEKAVPLLVVSAACGRFGLVLACRLGRYPWERGMGRDVVRNTGTRQCLTAAFLTVLCLPLAPLGVPLSIMTAGLVARGLASFAEKTLGGSNGDVLGATEVLCEIASLATLVATLQADLFLS